MEKYVLLYYFNSSYACCSYISQITEFQGKVGEFMVSEHVAKYLSAEYILLNNCTLPDQKDGTTQIDHILISPYGVFIVETKNYTGWILEMLARSSGHKNL